MIPGTRDEYRVRVSQFQGLMAKRTHISAYSSVIIKDSSERSDRDSGSSRTRTRGWSTVRHWRAIKAHTNPQNPPSPIPEARERTRWHTCTRLNPKPMAVRVFVASQKAGTGAGSLTGRLVGRVRVCECVSVWLAGAAGLPGWHMHLHLDRLRTKLPLGWGALLG